MNAEFFFRTLATEEISPAEEELAARLRMPLGHRDEAVDAVERELRDTLCAAACAVRVPIARKEENILVFPTFSVQSAALSKALEGCDEAYLFAATLGMQTERWLHRLSILSPAKHFIADALASAYAEAAADFANDLLTEGKTLTNRFSPGYGDLTLVIQPKILEATAAGKYLHITLSEGLLMIPQKSITAIIGIKKNDGQGEKI